MPFTDVGSNPTAKQRKLKTNIVHAEACVSDVGILYDFCTGKHGFSNCTAMLIPQQIIGYNVSRTRLSFGTGFAALLVDTQVAHALCKIIKRLMLSSMDL